jgi:hypothetical protein
MGAESYSQRECQGRSMRGKHRVGGWGGEKDCLRWRDIISVLIERRGMEMERDR